MKTFYAALGILSLLISLIIANSICLKSICKDFSKRLDEISLASPNDALPEIKELFSDFQRAEKFISITVSHEDLTNIEEGFAEMIGAAMAKDEEALIITKSRLSHSLEHLKRLLSINLDGVICKLTYPRRTPLPSLSSNTR